MNTSTPITANLVAEKDRMGFLPKHLGVEHFIVGKALAISWLERLAPRCYEPCRWEYFELSNGGFYLAPSADKRFNMHWAGNFFQGELSADGAGIVATLFALDHLAQCTDPERLRQFYLLTDYSRQHPEAGVIASAIL